MNWKSWDLSYFLCFVGERGAKKLNFLITFCVGVSLFLQELPYVLLRWKKLCIGAEYHRTSINFDCYMYVDKVTPKLLFMTDVHLRDVICTYSDSGDKQLSCGLFVRNCK